MIGAGSSDEAAPVGIQADARGSEYRAVELAICGSCCSCGIAGGAVALMSRLGGWLEQAPKNRSSPKIAKDIRSDGRAMAMGDD